MKRYSQIIPIFLTALLLTGFGGSSVAQTAVADTLPELFVMVLGIAQDAGYPQMGCRKACCTDYWQGKETRKMVTSLAIVDRKTNQFWLVDATPDIKYQLKSVSNLLPQRKTILPDGIFLTHAHTGHYTGLMELGRESMGTNNENVYAMPRMKKFLETNGPWSQLVSLKNIAIHEMQADAEITLDSNLSITPFVVPHRDEYSETVGYVIRSKTLSVMFIPDIDKWEKFGKDITGEIHKVDYAIVDGTFYKNGELENRDMSEIPHPFVEESMKKFSSMPAEDKEKVIFIHFNHTNPLIRQKSEAKDEVIKAGFNVAYEKEIIIL